MPVDSTAEMLVSDADREYVLAALAEAMAKGFIDATEFAERTDRALAAGTRRELSAVLARLPMPPVPYDDRPVTLHGSSSSLKRGGDWAVPRRLVVGWQRGSIQLDFSKAAIAHPVVTIELAIESCSFEMRVPAAASVSLDNVAISRGSIEDHRRNPPRAGRPHFVLSGTAHFGSIEVRGPRPRPFGRR